MLFNSKKIIRNSMLKEFLKYKQKNKITIKLRLMIAFLFYNLIDLYY
jgi:hypothetical protein